MIYNEAYSLFAIISNILVLSAVILPVTRVIETPRTIYILEIFGILWCTFFLLFALFMPKVVNLYAPPVRRDNLSLSKSKSGISKRSAASTLELFDMKSSEIERKVSEYLLKCESVGISNAVLLDKINERKLLKADLEFKIAEDLRNRRRSFKTEDLYTTSIEMPVIDVDSVELPKL